MDPRQPLQLVFADPMPLVRAVHAALLFLEDSETDEVDPDAAQRGQAWIGSCLQVMTATDRTTLRHAFAQLADEMDGRGSEFASSLHDYLFGSQHD